MNKALSLNHSHTRILRRDQSGRSTLLQCRIRGNETVRIRLGSDKPPVSRQEVDSLP